MFLKLCSEISYCGSEDSPTESCSPCQGGVCSRHEAKIGPASCQEEVRRAQLLGRPIRGQAPRKLHHGVSDRRNKAWKGTSLNVAAFSC